MLFILVAPAILEKAVESCVHKDLERAATSTSAKFTEWKRHFPGRTSGRLHVN